ncbi:hypothetical protein C2S53_012566 [Perilla frutescens var. hirtella]|uniref:Uncharacterized protein n=1 Tax=Perilla frutescens var. hirtella TaxID=608512 RepID=A0AAD4IZX2_PERFH|nr:hypothetical protein C2S53_012566 [Perilla frutescens var. hirtella]
MPPKWVKGQPVIDIPVVGRSSMTKNAPDAHTQKLGLGKRLKHGDRLRKCIKENGKIPVIFRKKDGHPVGEYASMFMTELGIAVKKFVPLQVSGWINVTTEQKRSILNWLESAFMVDFGLGPNSVKKETEKLMNIRFRNHRRKMHQHYKALAHLPWEERLKCVPKEYCKSDADWEFMCKMFESETFKKKSVRNSGNRSKIKSSNNYCGGSKTLLQYDADDGSGEKDGITSSNETDNNPEKGCPGESAIIANNDKQIGSDNQDDGSQSLEEVDVAKGACDQVQESQAGFVARLGNKLQPAKSTSSNATSLTAENAKLRNELHSTRIALQLTEDKVRILEANQKRLEETIQANTQIMEANQRMMKQVLEKIASDIAQSLAQLPSSAPPPPCL